MRLTGLEDTDIALDINGQPVVDSEGSIKTVSGDDCWFQDILVESLTQEGEMLHEDEEGRWAYGFGLLEYVNEADEEQLKQDIYARVREKITKRDFIEPSSIRTTLGPRDTRGARDLSICFAKIDENDERNIDIRVNDTEVVIE